jgi:hypothetical protein
LKHKYPQADAAQFEKLIQRAATAEGPEVSLWVSVLTQATKDLIEPPSGKKYLRRDAAAFFLEGRHAGICDAVGINPHWLLECLERHAAKHLYA